MIANHVYREEQFKKKSGLNMGAAIGQMLIPCVWYKKDHFEFR